jgi:hypothetical protein
MKLNEIGLMRRVTILAVVLSIAALLGQSSAPAEKPAKHAGPLTAAEATAAFFEAVHTGDIDRAIAMTAPMPEDIPELRVREFYQVVSRHTNRLGRPEVVAHMRLDDAAVVVFCEPQPEGGGFELNPAYVARQDGRWLVTYKLTQFDEGFHEFDDETMADFRTLRTWYDGQEKVIREMLSAGES